MFNAILLIAVGVVLGRVFKLRAFLVALIVLGVFALLNLETILRVANGVHQVARLSHFFGGGW